ncbi:MAG TPA: DUF6491 family protein [Steroidobacteraceae bacterium]|nr:DUF6491 family protein [Steroidobacteraceae bacterium]
MSHLLRLAAAAAWAAALVSCATIPSDGPASGAAKTVRLPGKPGCFYLVDITHNAGSWTVLNPTELIVYAPNPRNAYLVKLFEPLPELPFNLRIGFQSTTQKDLICNDDLDNLIVPGPTPPHRVPIVAVHRLTLAEVNALLAQNHLKPVK